MNALTFSSDLAQPPGVMRVGRHALEPVEQHLLQRLDVLVLAADTQVRSRSRCHVPSVRTDCRTSVKVLSWVFVSRKCCGSSSRWLDPRCVEGGRAPDASAPLHRGPLGPNPHWLLIAQHPTIPLSQFSSTIPCPRGEGIDVGQICRPVYRNPNRDHLSSAPIGCMPDDLRQFWPPAAATTARSPPRHRDRRTLSL